jgi:hypothetical protein
MKQSHQRLVLAIQETSSFNELGWVRPEEVT